MRIASPSRVREGMVLLAVLVIVTVLSLAAYQYSDLMMAEYRAADDTLRTLQARAFAESGIHHVAALLSNPENRSQLNDNPFDNPAVFQNQIVQPAGGVMGQGGFSIVAPLGETSTGSAVTQGFRFGVTDEGGKINLNALLKIDRSGKVGHDILMKLPNMTEDIANAILDWIDTNDQPRLGGAENETYSTMTPPYRAKNGPLDSLEELLLVKGVTPELLFGGDRNRNGMLDADEENLDGQQGRGWAEYLTVYGREWNLDSESNPRIYLNDSDMTSLYQKLGTAVGQDLAGYILLARMYGTTTKSSSTGGSSKNTKAGSLQGLGTSGLLSSGKKASRKLSSVYDLINTQVSIPGKSSKDPVTIYESPLNDSAQLRQLLPLLLDKTTTNRRTNNPARININTAPEAVLYALPYLTPTEVQSILSARPAMGNISDPIYQTPAWLVTQANIPPATLKKLESYVTTTSQVYRVQSVGHFEGPGPTARIEAVIEVGLGRPRFLLWRDLSELGAGYDLKNGP